MNMPIAPAAAGTTVNPMTAGTSAAAASPLGGFEALLAALFGGEGQVVSPLMKTVQPTDGQAPADGVADQDTALGADASAAQTLLAAFAMAPAPAVPLVVPTAPQGEAEGAASTGGPNVQPLAAQTVPGIAVPEQAVPGQAVPAEAAPGQADPAPTGLNEAVPASTPPLANAPGQAPAGQAQLAATTPPAPAIATQSAEGDVAPQGPLPDLTLQGAEADPAIAPPPSQPAPQAPAAPQAQQIAAASQAPAQKSADASAKAPDAQSPTATAEGEAEPGAAAASGAAAAKPSAATEATPNLRKGERADAAIQPPAPQADAASQPTHTHVQAETAPSGTAASAHAPAAHAAGVRGAPETVATLAAEILKKLDSRTTRFDMELQPHGLGKVDVRLEIGAHGRLTAAMAFENPQSAQELKNRSGELIRALEQAGFDVSDGLSFDVADNSNGSGQNNGNGAQAQNQDAPWRGRAFLSALETAGAADAPPIAPMNIARLRASGVDIKI